MKFSELYQDGQFHHSIEVFPPKTDKSRETLITELTALQATKPAYVSVTYGAMGSTRDLTKDLAIQIHDDFKCPTAFHFTCVGADREAIKNYVTELANRDLKLVVALRGDKPQNQSTFTPPQNGFRYASELVGYLKSIGDFSIAVAGYPEKHAEAVSLEDDINHLKEKVDAGADIIITQLFFQNERYYDWVEKIRAKGINIPVVAGIMPMRNAAQIKRITGLCGASLPQDLLSQIERFQDDADSIVKLGIDHASKQCLDLRKQGVAGIHFYCLNKADSVLAVLNNMGIKS
ncbi:MAG: methylenetetrahydrofolate reductase [NAD(P)H] [Deltaproteobacteria bacterium]|nr:methylenetetrahydrofolate reductase [NAD(P)H] [Deltaproteobacteria bacterium]